jgi:hypothetical protein
MGIKSNILINVDVRKAIADYGKLLAAANNTNQGITKGSNKAKMSVDQLGGSIGKTSQGAAAGAVGFQTMSMGMLNLSTSAVQTYTSLSNLDRVQNRAAASAVGLQRAQDLLARKQTQLVKLQEAGNGAGRDAVLITKEITTATNDLAVKADKLKIEQAAVTDVYMLFFANIANVGVSTMMVMSNMMSAAQVAKLKDIVTTKAQIVWNRLKIMNDWKNVGSTSAATVATNLRSIATAAMTVVTKIATVAMIGLNAATGVIGVAIMALAAVVLILTTNMYGVTDAIKAFLGIESESTKAVDDGTVAINEQTMALDKQNKSYKDMTQPMQNYIKMMKEAALQSGDLSRIKHAAQIGVGGGSGFSPGVGSPNYSSGGATGSGISAGGGGDTGSFTSTNTVGGSDRFTSSIGPGKAVPGQSVIETVQDISKPNVSRRNTTNRYSNSFEAANEPLIERGDIATNTSYGGLIPDYTLKDGGSNWINSATPGYSVSNKNPFAPVNPSYNSMYPSPKASWVKPNGNRFSMNNKSKMSGTVKSPLSLIDIFRNNGGTGMGSLTGESVDNFGALGSAEGAMQFYSLQPTEQESWLIGQLESLPENSPQYNEMFQLFKTTSLETNNFTMESPARKAMKIEMIKGADNFFGGVDNISSELGGYRPTGISESITSNRSGLAFFLQGKDKLDPSRTIFHAGTGGLEIAQNMLAGNENFGRSSGMVAALSRLQAQGLDFTKTNTNLGTHSMTQFNAMNQGYNVSSGGRGYSQSEIDAGANANTTWNGRASDAFYAANRKADMMANTGFNNIIGYAGDIFGGSFKGSPGNRSTLPTPTHWQKFATTQSMAKVFGSDEIANQEMAQSKQQLDIDLASGRPGGIQPFINRYYERSAAIAARSNSRAAASIGSLGINFNPNANDGHWYKYVVGKGKIRYGWRKTSLSSEDQIRADIMASDNVILPSVSRLRAISASFANNGNFTNFDNTAITQEAMGTLGMTEQKVFDLRFNETRGDRELENRMRHIEQQAASSSGTSPL